ASYLLAPGFFHDRVLAAGAAKVSLNSAAVKRPGLVREAAEKFGAERITIAIDARRNPAVPSGFELVVAGGTRPVGKDAVAWAAECERLGAGAVLPTSMDGDGTLSGYDLELIRAVADAVRVPVVASGGAGKLEHFHAAATRGGASVLLAASVFHFRTLRIAEVKRYLRAKGVEVFP
ncbi:MAG TPA: HisA/HisF-related TIM barrel protein, partial [Planctomycetota bacterium]|nr:HisA/HisF-related TIM barrel protein [Planctomycetota bacterium]